MVKVRLQIIYIFLLFQMSNSLLISAKVRLIFLLCIPPQKIKYFWPRRDSNTQPSDLESDALPLRHGVTVYWWWDFGLEKREGSTEIWTRIAGFKVQSANHYTIEPGSTRMGFEPTRAEPNGLAVHRLNHSATSSCVRAFISSFLNQGNWF